MMRFTSAELVHKIEELLYPASKLTVRVPATVDRVAAVQLCTQAFAELEAERDYLQLAVGRLVRVVEAADTWREALNLEDTSWGGEIFCECFTAYDDVRDAAHDLVPVPGRDEDDSNNSIEVNLVAQPEMQHDAARDAIAEADKAFE